MASPTQIQYIRQRAAALGLDPAAVLAIASHEGLGGGIGDHGTSFGPWQLHIGGAMPSGIANPQQWAWSQQGIDYALGKMAGAGAKGLKGRAAIEAISRNFERPADPNSEIADALSHYGQFSAGSSNGRTLGSGPSSGGSSPSPATIDAGGGQSRQQLAQLLLGGGGRINFNSNQVQTPNLVAMAQLRQLDATGQGKVSGVSAPLAAATVSGGSKIGQSIAKTALSQLGQPYQYGGQAKLGHPTDCSGLLQESAAAHGISIPRTTYDQWKVGKAVPTNQLQPGDAVFFKGSDARGNLPGHVGIYIGGGKFVEDPHTGGTVSISTLAGRSDYVGARRFY